MNVCGPQGDCVSVLLNLLVIGLSNGAVIALNAIGFTLLYGVIRTINFAYGDVFALGTVVVSTLVTSLNIGPASPLPVQFGGLLLVIVVVVGFAIALNLGIEVAAFRPFRGRSYLAPLIASLGLSFVLYQAALVWRKLLPSWIPGEHRSFPGVPEVPRGSIPELLPNANLAPALGLGEGVTLAAKDALIVIVAVVAALVVSLFLARSRTGRALRAVAQDPTLAAMSGVPLTRAVQTAFAISGALAGLSAFAFVLYTTHPFGQHGAQSGLLAFTAVILGGVGSPIGALLAGLVLGVFAAFSDYYVAAQWTPVLLQMLLIALLILRPTGLVGRESAADLNAPTARDAIAFQGRGPTRRERWLAAGLLAAGLAYPLFDAGFAWSRESTITSILLLALMALGLNVMLGFAGMLDLGYAASVGLGAYTAALLVDPFGRLAAFLPHPLDILLVLLAGMAIAAVFGLLNGLLTARLRADYLAIVTLAFGAMVRQIAINLSTWTGGMQGRSALPAPSLLGVPLTSPAARYYLVLALVVAAVWLSFRLIRSRQGRAWRALGEDEVAAASSGVNVARSKVVAFAIGTALGGLAGAAHVASYGQISPEQIDFTLSVMVLAAVVIGGPGSVLGIVVGALAIGLYDRVLLPGLGGWLADYRLAQGGTAALFDLRELNFLAFGLVLYLTILWRAGRASRGMAAPISDSGPDALELRDDTP